MAGAFDHVDEVWVPSTFCQRAVAERSPVPVLCVPHAVAVPERLQPDRARFGLQADSVVFLAMADVMSSPERKNPFGAIDAFVRAFGTRPVGVELVVKVSNGDRDPAAMQRLHRLAAGCNGLHLVDGYLDRSALNSLIDSADVFVSLHRAEGFGLVIAEAMVRGKVVIATAWSGNMDFMSGQQLAAGGLPAVQASTPTSAPIGATSAGPFIRHARAADVPRFELGVASGQPRADGMVLWTRLTGPDLPPGARCSGNWRTTRPSRASPRAAAKTPRRLGAQRARRARGLEPARWYWYRFRALGQVSRVGRTRTAPAPDAAATLRLAIASCQRWDHGHWAAWRHMATQDLDLVAFLGDYIYEYPSPPRCARAHEGGLLRTLEQYRDRYASTSRPGAAGRTRRLPVADGVGRPRGRERLRRQPPEHAAGRRHGGAAPGGLPGLLGTPALPEGAAPARHGHAHHRPAGLGPPGAHPPAGHAPAPRRPGLPARSCAAAGRAR
jgi:hypothetical protein